MANCDRRLERVPEALSVSQQDDDAAVLNLDLTIVRDGAQRGLNRNGDVKN